MSTQRYISTSFWTDKWIRSLDPSERYLYMYLLTNPQTNIAGIYQITLDRIAFDTGYDERTLRPILERFRKMNKAAFVHDEWVILPSWPKHQKWDIKETIKKGIESTLKSIPQNVLYEAKAIGYQYPIDSLLVGYVYSPSYSDTDSDTDLDSDIDTEAKSPDKPALPEKQKRTKKDFIPPTLEELTEYIVDKKLAVNPFDFMNWYTKSDWKDNQGNQVKNWKNKAINWDARELKKNPVARPYSKPYSSITVIDRTCPICKGVLKNGQYCKVCDKFFDEEGKELYS
jgi:hypothetical protein